MLGETLNGRYRCVRQLGGGGMGAVFEAEDAETGARVAVKVISTGDLSRDKKLIARFHREIKATGSIDTDHIVRVFDTGADASTGQPFMVMEYLVGEDLAQVYRRLGQVRPELALRIVAQTCLGLGKAHEARIVHRDIKPANLFLAEQPDGQLLIKLLDFGVAKIKMDQQNVNDPAGLTRTGSMVGSPLYMAPEQARGSKAIDHRADIWSLGIVFYQALSGRTPHHDIEALGELIIAICSELPRPVQEFAPWVPPEVAEIVHRALRFDPGERFQTAEEMLAAIKPLLPDGWSLRPEMLETLRAEDKARVAEKITVPQGFAAPMSRHVTTPPPTHDHGATPPTGALAPPSSAGGAFMAAGPASAPMGADAFAPTMEIMRPDGSTTEGSSRSTIPKQVPASRLPLVVGAAAAIGLIVGLGAYKLMSPVPPATPEKTAGPIVATAPPPATTPAQLAPPPGKRTVKVAILPRDAEVEVGGAKVELKDGVLEITGAPGSVHHVRVIKGKDRIEDEVVVTDEGPRPAKIELAAKGAPPHRK